jgi:hypothetical protein
MKSPLLVGNKIDKELQACNLGQTKGIAIGPDTSLGVAELMMSNIDAELFAACNPVGGVRFIDDIELSFSRLADADRALMLLEQLLSEYELQLNSTKTSIIELPGEIESIYVTELRRYLPGGGSPSKSQLVDYFNKAFELARAAPQEGVLRYAIAALPSVGASPGLWPLLQSLLWQCIAIDPGTLRFVIDALQIQRLAGPHAIDKALASYAINSLIDRSAVIGHGSEVLWALWAAIYFELSVSLENQNLISQMDDSLVAVAAMYARDCGVFNPHFDSALWKSWIASDEFCGEYWLLEYEAQHRGWFSAEVAAAALKANSVVSFLDGCGVTFIDDGARHTYLPARLAAASGVSGGGY